MARLNIRSFSREQFLLRGRLQILAIKMASERDDWPHSVLQPYAGIYVIKLQPIQRMFFCKQNFVTTFVLATIEIMVPALTIRKPACLL